MPFFSSEFSIRSVFNFAPPVGKIVAFVPVVFPLQRLQIIQIVRATFGYRLYVVYLPSILLRSSVLGVQHTRPAHVLAEAAVFGFRRAFFPTASIVASSKGSPLLFVFGFLAICCLQTFPRAASCAVHQPCQENRFMESGFADTGYAVSCHHFHISQSF